MVFRSLKIRNRKALKKVDFLLLKYRSLPKTKLISFKWRVRQLL
jgi:hypothetical protein